MKVWPVWSGDYEQHELDRSLSELRARASSIEREIMMSMLLPPRLLQKMRKADVKLHLARKFLTSEWDVL